MNLLLIGCTGFIGRELVPLLLAEGHKLTVVTRSPKKALKTIDIGKEIKILNFDPAKSSSWGNEELINCLKSSDGVINLAGEPIADKRWTTTHCEEIRNSRLETTKNLIQAITKIKKPPKVLINASAIGFYGTHPNKQFNEESTPGKDFLASLCQEWESLASEKPKRTRLVIIRIGIVLAKGGGALGKMLPIFKAGLGGPIGDGEQWMSWIHRTDLCNIIKESIRNSSWSGVINGVAPNPIRMNEFSNLLGKKVGRPTLLAVPAPLLTLILGDGAQVVLEGQNVQSKRLNKLRFIFLFSELKDAFSASISNNKNN